MTILEKLGSNNLQNSRTANEALNQLKDAASLIGSYIEKDNPLYKRLMAITLNNIACYYKQYVIFPK